MRFIITILTVLAISLQIIAQADELTPENIAQINKIVALIKNDDVLQLSEMVEYPIKRPNPIPDINSKEEFILYYPILFDDFFKQALIKTKFTHENVVDNSRGLGLLYGDLWLNEKGKIMTVNYSSSAEVTLQKKLIDETKSVMHKSVNKWKENIIVCETDKYLIRVDMLDDDSYRYTSWNKPKTISEKPDLVLFNGEQEFQGTMGGVTYTFKNSDWVYIIDDVHMCEYEKNCGLFLRISKDEVLKSEYKCKWLK
jgi:hypothetical protein